MPTTINIARVYADPEGHDGFRVLVDRLWPQGESHQRFHYDLWAKDVAPSTELRQWLHQNPAAEWTEFERRYLSELDANPAATELVATLRPHPLVTLLYASRDTRHNNALVLQAWLQQRLQ